MAQQNDVQALIDKADRLVREAKASLQASADFYHAEGLDPDKVQSVLGGLQTDETRAKAEAAFREDMDAIDREVAEEAARLSFDKAGSPAPRTLRRMV